MPDPAQSYGHSTNYLGDARLKSNRSANIADDRNCSFWLMGLPANTSYSALLGAIRNAGKIYATNINAPTGEIATCAAKIVFFQRTAAETLMRQIKNGKLYVVGKRITSVRWNKVKSGEHPYREQSRAIRITGPADLMNFEYFEIFFSCRFVYVLTWKGQSYCEDPGMVSHEWHFASLRAQAKAANAAIEREFVGRFKVHWAPDPCDCYCSR
ncbi:hypothetical protein BJ878DRAFT_419836 [Calycina marina]|uniref:RRM domain-containing protein n=1 Tax=Calycina marina TaxID=1763456 RepID=A0A9P7Z4E9_9HELO|nr:hypothetical protein BJ878DRAFT_419836 [Calycina marina]